MPFNVVFSCPEAAVWEGPGKDKESTFETFEAARDAAIEDLEYHLETIKANIEELRAAKKLTDLHYHQ